MKILKIQKLLILINIKHKKIYNNLINRNSKVKEFDFFILYF